MKKKKESGKKISFLWESNVLKEKNNVKKQIDLIDLLDDLEKLFESIRDIEEKNEGKEEVSKFESTYFRIDLKPNS